MRIVSLILGVLSIIGTCIGFWPFLSFLSLITIPLAGAGLVIGVIVITGTKGSKRLSIIAIICNLSAIIFGIMRLYLFYPTF